MEEIFEKYELKIAESLQHFSDQKPAMVWALVLIARTVAGLADAVRYRTSGYTATAVDVSSMYTPTDFDSDIISPFCAYCAQSVNTAGDCMNPECPGK